VRCGAALRRRALHAAHNDIVRYDSPALTVGAYTAELKSSSISSMRRRPGGGA